jgi:2,4-dienoyl-CoA reductase-like NADH-dependent reductase (Old Yellow Enzyme family)
MSLDHVFKPIDLGSVSVKNRIVRASHGTALGAPTMQTPGEINDAFIAYHEARARGGVGLTILEIGSVLPNTPTPIRAWEDDVVGGYERIAAAIRPHGMKLFQQLYHAGHHVAIGAPQVAPWSASDVPSPWLGLVPRPMTKAQIDEIVDAFAKAARRVQDGGIDGIEIHAAHGYLIGQFISPLTNRREDDYGGPLHNRLRLLHEILAAVRAEVGPDFPVGARLSAAEGVSGGMDAYGTKEIAAAIDDEVDFLDVSYANYHNFDRMVGGMHEAHGYELPAAEVVLEGCTVPSMVTGRIPTLEEADAVIAAGIADLVSMVRATIADPEIVRKTQAGEAAAVRPCIYCNQGCLGGYGLWGRVGCAVNVAAGRETQVPSDVPLRAARARAVVVVGGGPAGLEAARTAALRGHRVTLFEARDRLGGRINLVRELPSSSETGRIVDWLAAELGRLEVDVRLGVAATAESVKALDPDVVIVAAGTVPRRDGLQAARPAERIPGVGLPHVGAAEELFDGSLEVGETALVLDDVGHNEGIACAEELRRRGASVTFVTRFSGLGTKLVEAVRDAPARRRLFGQGFELIPYAMLSSVAPGKAEVKGLDVGDTRTVRADTVVLANFPKPRREIADELEGRVEVALVGDANAPRDLVAAIHEGHFAARRI